VLSNHHTQEREAVCRRGRRSCLSDAIRGVTSEAINKLSEGVERSGGVKRAAKLAE
jgi:hypothetical protein